MYPHEMKYSLCDSLFTTPDTLCTTALLHALCSMPFAINYSRFTALCPFRFTIYGLLLLPRLQERGQMGCLTGTDNDLPAG